MHDPRFLREHRDVVRAGVLKKAGAEPEQLARFWTLEEERLALLAEADALKQKRNQASEEIARLKKEGGDATARIAAMKGVSDRIKELDDRLRVVEADSEEAAAWIPNLPHDSVPEGRDSTANVEVARWGTLRTFDFTPKPHWEVAAALGIIDFERGPKLAGAGFPLFVGDGARLVRALIDYMLDLHVEKHGYTEVHPSIVINSKSLRGTGQLPKMAEDMYHIAEDDLWLNPTAEVPVTNIHRDEILEPGVIPRLLTAYCPSFRREAGAYGKDTRGLYRVHQFTKVEQVIFCAPDEEVAEKEHYQLLANAEAILAKLEIPYRVAIACTGEIGLGQTRKHEVESWMPGRKAYSETHSCSTLGDFQARRSNIRLRLADGSLGYPYTLNNTAIASPRILIPLLENHQNDDGSVTIPKALRPYLGGVDVIRPKR